MVDDPEKRRTVNLAIGNRANANPEGFMVPFSTKHQTQVQKQLLCTTYHKIQIRDPRSQIRDPAARPPTPRRVSSWGFPAAKCASAWKRPTNGGLTLNMKLLSEAARRLKASPRALAVLFTTVLGLIVPRLASAAEGDVVLNFTSQDKIYLYVSLAFGIFAIIVAFVIRSSLMQQSPGSEKMQEVGLAIREGALAYLQRQVKTMLIFVVILAALLAWLFSNSYGWTVSGWIAIAFIMGVAASYIAGYAGMLMAVNGNMRTANAALTSYKKSLEVAFRSGAVAGLLTVGLGLIGATIIILAGGPNAMRILVGFGFGGSLAALFMRVGGGIFTKAADVGADLVGKVEAGIPEDDPRNPATIADNVGDNVGDCAGMAADVFESYEVTLVAAILLGAATSVIFDQTTWMRLVLFALMARGVGIVASVIGIIFVKGTDDVDADPLKRIRSGFYTSALIAAVLTAGLAFFMMGGTGTKIQTNKYVSLDEIHLNQFDALLSAAKAQADAKHIPLYQVKVDDLKDDPAYKNFELVQPPQFGASEEAAKADLAQRLIRASDQIPQLRKSLPDLSDAKILDPQSTDPYMDFAVHKLPNSAKELQDMNSNPATAFERVRDLVGDSNAKMFLIHSKTTMPSPAKGVPPTTMETDYFTGPATQAYMDENVKGQNNANQQVTITNTFPVRFYGGSNGIQMAIDGQGPNSKFQPTDFGGSYYPAPLDQVQAAFTKAGPGGQPDLPAPSPFRLGFVTHAVVPWEMFFFAIFFGLLMAFAIEYLTDYYVSTHKRPTQEVAGVSTAGPAPMIIQGFAYAAESSVFMVFSIVVALLVPLFLFSPAMYGSLILSFYGIALVGLGLLTTTGYVLAMDTFGPISDNAQGVYEMSGEGHGNEYGSKAVQRLDAAGNTTKALTKGFAIATAVVAAVALFHTFLESAHLQGIGLRLDLPQIFLGLLIGGAAPYLFSAFSINAVGRASFQLINEVRRQFKADPGIMAGTSKPNYGRCVAIVTQAAQKELLGPGILAIALPLAVAFGFSIGQAPTNVGGQLYNLTGAQALGGYLAGAILSGQLMAVLLANSGGMWDNAKKLIEDGLYGGKGTDAHKAGVVCDTVGDPFKDTAGPALNPLIKVMNLVAVLLAPVVIQPFGNGVLVTVTAIALAALAFSIYFSKKGSLSTSLQAAAEEGHQAAEHKMPMHDLPTPQEATRRKITVEDATGDGVKVED